MNANPLSVVMDGGIYTSLLITEDRKKAAREIREALRGLTISEAALVLEAVMESLYRLEA